MGAVHPVHSSDCGEFLQLSFISSKWPVQDFRGTDGIPKDVLSLVLTMRKS